MNQRRINLRRPLVASYQSTEGLQPTVAPLDDPAPLVAPPLSPILMRRHSVIAARRNNRLYPAFHQQRPHFVAIIAAVTDQPLRLATSASARLHFDAIECRLDEFDLCRGSRLQVYSERSTRAIGQYHKLCSLAAFSLPD